MKEFVIRTITGTVFAVLVIGSILWSPWAFFVLMAVFTVIGLAEFVKLFPAEPKVRGTVIYYFLGFSVYVLIGLTGLNVIDRKSVV